MKILNIKVKTSFKNISLGLSFIFVFYSEDENGIFLKLYIIKCKNLEEKLGKMTLPLWPQLHSSCRQTFVIKSITFPPSVL